jgi:tryptophan synthase beta chain
VAAHAALPGPAAHHRDRGRQWGSALAFACAQFGLECDVWMVRASHDQKPYRRSLMRIYGARVHASPSTLTSAGSRILAGDPDSPGSLGIAISEAVEAAAGADDTRYARRASHRC